MPEFLTTAFKPTGSVSISAILIRLAVALVLGGLVAWIYRRARPSVGTGSSFPGTLVLLCILISMVTQVIGDNVARAFSLVGALSIVRFRTVVRDTQDTAYVIFAVVVGMAVGAQDLWVAGIGIVTVSIAAFFLRTAGPTGGLPADWLLNVRLNVGVDPASLLARITETHIIRSDLVSAETARQGISLDVAYNLVLRPDASPAVIVQRLNQIEGVQTVSLARRETEMN
jgi:hypothetical protein